MANLAQTTGPDLKQGISEGDLTDGAMIAGHVDGEAVLVARQGKDVFAIGPPAPIMAVLSVRACWRAARCAAHGTTPASACARETR